MICKHMFVEIKSGRVPLLNDAYETRLHDGPVVRVSDVSNEKFKRFLPWLGPSLWNSLPPDIRNIDNFTSFVSELKRDFRAHFQMDEYFQVI